MTEPAVEPTVEATATVTSEPEPKPKPTETVDFWKQKAREQEQRAKANADAAKRLAELEESSKTETQKAIDAAKREADQAARAEMSKEFGRRIAAAEIKAALAGLDPDPEAIVEDLNLDRFITDDGEVDTDAVAKLREKYAARAQPGRPRGDADQGPRGAVPALNGDPLAASIENILNAR